MMRLWKALGGWKGVWGRCSEGMEEADGEGVIAGGYLFVHGGGGFPEYNGHLTAPDGLDVGVLASYAVTRSPSSSGWPGNPSVCLGGFLP